jgi:hypothetical protein
MPKPLEREAKRLARALKGVKDLWVQMKSSPAGTFTRDVEQLPIILKDLNATPPSEENVRATCETTVRYLKTVLGHLEKTEGSGKTFADFYPGFFVLPTPREVRRLADEVEVACREYLEARKKAPLVLHR